MTAWTHNKEVEVAGARATASVRVVAGIRLLWRERRLVTIVTAITTICGLVVSLSVPPRYESSTKILPSPPSLLDRYSTIARPGADVVAGLAGLGQTGGAPNDRFVALLQSRVVADRIVDQFGLMHLFNARYRFEARVALAQHMSIQQDRKTGIITITYSDRDPHRAVAIAQAYVMQLEKFNAEMNTTGAHLEREFLEQRALEVDKQLQDAAGQLSRFSTSSRILDTVEQPKGTIDEAMKLRAEITNVKAELNGLEQQYNPGNVKVRSSRARLFELTQELNNATNGRDNGADSLPSISSLPGLGATYSELARRVKLLEAVQMQLSEELEMAKTQEVRELPAFRVMEQAEVPEQRVWPRRTFIVMLSFILGLFVGLASVIGKMKWNEMDDSNPFKELLFDVNRAIFGKSIPPSRMHGRPGSLK
jgi:uncharacterized protein involved in exopolysaccharide biosynthesis